MAFVIRELMKNGKAPINFWDMRDAYGPNVEKILVSLDRAGMLRITGERKLMYLKLIAPGDFKRKRCRDIMRRHREELRNKKAQRKSKKGNRT